MLATTIHRWLTRGALVALLYASQVLIGSPSARAYDTQTEYCYANYVTGYSWTHETHGVGGGSFGTCTYLRISWWNQCDGGYGWHTGSSGWMSGGGVAYYTLCGFNLMWSINQHQGMDSQLRESPTFYTEEYAGP